MNVFSSIRIYGIDGYTIKQMHVFKSTCICNVWNRTLYHYHTYNCISLHGQLVKIRCVCFIVVCVIFFFPTQNLQGLTGTPLVAGSPIRHEGSLQCNPVEVQTFQPPWKALSEFALQSDLDQPAFQQLVSVSFSGVSLYIASPSVALALPPSMFLVFSPVHPFF